MNGQEKTEKEPQNAGPVEDLLISEGYTILSDSHLNLRVDTSRIDVYQTLGFFLNQHTQHIA